MSNDSVAEFLSRIALLLDLKGENPFKVKSYRNAAMSVESLEDEVSDLVEQGTITKVKGIGRGIAESLAEYMDRGSCTLLEELEAEVPEGLLDMVSLRGLGPAKVKVIHEKLGITTLGELEYACQENRLHELKGFGEKTQEKILKEIQFTKQHAGLFHLHYASFALEEAELFLKEMDDVIEVATSGQVRRSLEMISHGDLVVSSENPESLLEALPEHEEMGRVIRQEGDCITIVHPHGFPFHIHVVSPGSFAARLVDTTGSEEHVAKLKSQAESREFTLKPEGLFKSGSKKPKAMKDEQSLYASLELSWIPPELREGGDEVKAAVEGELPELVEAKDLKGVLHMHTTYSDGRNSIKEMADAAMELGYDYIGISDHSRTASYAGGLTIERLKKQASEVKALNKALQTDPGTKGFKVLHGIESDILNDGSLDYPDKTLGLLDFVIASVHSNFTMDEETMTRRIIKAVRHPATSILGHPTGRLLLGREAYPVDMAAVLEACAECKVMVEINANPHRLDVDWRWLGECRRLGIMVCINPDAHRVDGFHDMAFGLGIARKGGLEKKHVANCLEVDELTELWRKK